MQNVSRVFPTARRRPLPVPTCVNHEGAPAYRRSLREQVVQVLMTGTLGDTFYATGRDLASEAIAVFVEAREKCPEFLARAIVYAREQGFMKTLPVLGLCVLSGTRSRIKPIFLDAFRRVIRTPDDARAFAALAISGVIPGRNGLGGMAREAMRDWLPTMSEYHVVKYGSTASKDVTLRDIVRMTHPTPSSPAVSERFGWLCGGFKKLGIDSELNPQIRAFEALKRASTESEVLRLIREGRLPYEVVVPSVGAMTPAIWAELLRQAPYMNLLRGLATFTRHDVFKDETNVRIAVQKLGNAEAIRSSKTLPFRFFSAWKRYMETEGFDSRVADAIRAGLEASFCNMPSLGEGTVAIGSDVSGSMSSGTLSEEGTTRYIDIAGIFTGALLRRAEGRVIPLPFDVRVYPDCGLSGRDEILTTTEKLTRFGGGGTAIGSPVEYLLQHKLKVDTFIGITDNVDWAYGEDYLCNGSFLKLWRSYRKEIAPGAKAYLVTIAPYREVVAPQSEEGIRFIYGWSDSVLKYIAQDLRAGESQVQEIERMPLQTGVPYGSSAEDANTEEG